MKRVLGGCLALLLCGLSARAQGVITTYAGGNWVFNGNGKPAVNAPLGMITGITRDPSGNIVIADFSNFLVERVNSDSTLSVIAGNGLYFFFAHTGDGGPAVAANIMGAYGVGYDSQGNLYIAEYDRISRVSPQGIISTFAGGGADVIGNGIPARQAAIRNPGGLVVGSDGTIYYSEPAYNRVRKVTPDGRITTVAGTGFPGFSGDNGPATAANLNDPLGLALDVRGNLYVADSGNLRIREITADGTIGSILSNVIATGLAFDRSGALYIGGAGAVYKYTPGILLPVQIAGPAQSTTDNGGFSGDGGPALSARFSLLLTVVADDQGNVFVADGDNFRVRRISPDGIVTTIAGNGNFYYTGENVPALIEPVLGEGSLAIDQAGILYYSENETGRVRKVSGGIITTVAGAGGPGSEGDGGPAVKARLFGPRGLAFDAANNLYVADSRNFRVRKVTPGGTISTYATLPSTVWGLAFDATGNLYVSVQGNSTVYRIDPKGNQTVFAGTGTYGYAGDGGPATAAKLNNPGGLAVDAQGNLYIADMYNGCVRVVNPQGVISTLYKPSDFGIFTELAFDRVGNLYISDASEGLVLKRTPGGSVSIFAGNPNGDFPGDGELSTMVGLTNTGIACDAAGNVYIDETGHGIEVVLATAPTMSLETNTVSLTASSGGAPATQAVLVKGSIPALEFKVSISTANGDNWLSTDATAALTPDLLSVTADPSKLAPGIYTGTITIAPSLATPTALTIAVRLTVGAALPPQLAADQTNVSFTYPAGAAVRSSSLTISNTGGGALGFTVSATTKTGGSWLTVTPASGSVSPGAPVTLKITADPTKLPAGNYAGTVSIQSKSGGNLTIPINMTISRLSQALLLTQSGMSFTAVAQGGVVPPQSFGVVNLGTGSLPWTASVSTLAGGRWLNVTPASGSSDPALAAPQITVTVNQSGLAPGDYYGLVQVDAPGAANTPQAVSVFLSVLPAGSDPGARVQPAELFFSVTPDSFGPSSQDVFVYDIGGQPKSFYVAIPSSQTALAVLPGRALLDPANPTRVIMQPGSYLEPGAYDDVVGFQFSDGRVQQVKIHVISANRAKGTSGSQRPRDIGEGCTPTTLIPALTTLPPSFAVTAGWPVALSVSVRDDCGNSLTSGTVTVGFSNLDPPLALNSLNNGTWQATWPAQSGAGKPVTLTITAVNNQLQISGTRQVDGSVSTSKDPPVVTQAGIVSAASPAPYTALAPGSIISIYGQHLADFTDAPSTLPLPTTLGNTKVIIQGRPVPLFYAGAGQINALVPFGLNANTIHQVLVQRGLTYSYTVPVNVADAQPGVFLSGSNAIVYAYRGSAAPFLVTSAAPAQAGDVLVLYCAGLGLVDQPVTDGAASPTAHTQSPVTVSIGGQDGAVQFAGLVAGFVGLYQVNVTIPVGVQPGTSVPVTITVAGQTSPVANLAVR
jgi:uncharacterized protein (TIGR03437 family)